MNNHNKKNTILGNKSILLLIIILTASIVRFYNFDNRLIYGPEQGISLITSAKYIHEKFTLLGQIDLIRDTSKHHTIFSGALFNYSLIPLQYLFNYDPYPITIFFSLLNIFTGIVLYFLFRPKIGFVAAVFSLIFFLFNHRMIQHSLFIWIYNYTPLVFVISLNLLLNYFKKQKTQTVFILGILSGIGFNLLYPYFFIALVFLLLISLKSSPSRLIKLIFFIIGGIFGNFSMILFDLRHNFYHFNTLFRYTLDVIESPSKNQFTYYHLLPLYPLFALILGIITSFIYRLNKTASMAIIIGYIFINLTSPVINFSASTGMLPGITLKTFKDIAVTIATDNPPAKYNLAVLLDFDTRAHPLRYLLDYIHGYRSQAVDQYADLEALYVFAPKDYDINKPKVWELQVYLPYNVKTLESPSPNYRLYKLYR